MEMTGKKWKLGLRILAGLIRINPPTLLTDPHYPRCGNSEQTESARHFSQYFFLTHSFWEILSLTDRGEFNVVSGSTSDQNPLSRLYPPGMA
jgi:hypothetical protein